MRAPGRLRVGWPALALAATLAPAAPVGAQIVTDGSVGPAVALAGPDYVIPADLGQQSGGNLFHSFDTFGVASGESATFTDTGSVAPIERVLGRVTGGSPSEIDGLLRSEIPGADLYLLNPSGVVLGPDARLDVQGSFHTSTADEVRFPNGERFETRAGGEVPLLTVAAPEAFGFLSEAPASIEVADSLLTVPEGESLSLVGGDVTLAGGSVQAPTGRLDLVAVGSPGLVTPGTGAEAPTLEGFSAPGDIHLEAGGASTSGVGGGGQIFLRGGDIRLVDASLESDAVGGTRDAGRVDVEANEIRLAGGSRIDARSFGSGDAGSIALRAEGVLLDGGMAEAALDVSTFGAGMGGRIGVTADRFELRSGSIHGVARPGSTGDAGTVSIAARDAWIDAPSRPTTVDVATFGPGQAGRIEIGAGRLLITGNPVEFAAVGAATNSSGSAGEIRVNADVLEMGNASLITAVAGPGSTGDAGLIDVEARSVILAGGPNFAGLDTATYSSGRGGHVRVAADTVELHSASIGSEAARGSTGDAGSVSIAARELTLDAERDNSRVGVRSFGEGSAGSIRVEAGRVHLQGGSFAAGIDAASFRGGDGGEIQVTAEALELRGEAFLGVITGEGTSGDAGRISVVAGRVELDGRESGVARFDARTLGRGTGGEIQVTADSFELQEGFVDSSAGLGSSGDAGSIEIDAGRVFISGSPTFTPVGPFTVVIANTSGSGDAGTVRIRADSFEMGNLTAVAANADPGSTGDAGRVEVDGGHMVMAGVGNCVCLTADTASTGRGGEVEVTAETLEMHSAFIGSQSGTGASGDGGSVSVVVGELTLDAVFEPTRISGRSLGSGRGGSIRVEADRIRIEGGPFEAGIDAASVFGRGGAAGDVTVVADEILLHRGFVGALSDAPSDPAGSIVIEADRLELVDAGLDGRSFGAGAAGSIRLDVGELDLARGGIDTSSYGGGDAGIIEVDADRLDLVDAKIDASSFGGGDAGAIEVDAGRIAIVDGGEVRARTTSGGSGGAVAFRASESIEISGENALGDESDVETSVMGFGNAGTIELSAPDVLLDDHALVASAQVPGFGEPGEVRILADRVEIRGGALVSTSALGGAAGAITIEASESVRISNAGGVPLSLQRLISESVPGPAGVFAATLFGEGRSGSVGIRAPLVQIVDGGMVLTTTLDRADAGSLSIAADRVEVLDGGLVDSSSRGGGAAGTLRIQATDTVLVAGADASGAPSRVRSAATASGAGGDVLLVAPEIRIEGGAVATTTVGESGTGTGGAITIRADRLELAEGGRIDSGSFSLADGGRIELEAREALEIRGAGSGVFAETGGPGAGGEVALVGGRIRIEDGGLVSSRSGSDIAGAVPVFEDAVAGGFMPALRAPPTDVPGEAGNVELAAGSLKLVGGAIDTEAEVGAGGNIGVQVEDLLLLQDASLSASVGSGSGGNIEIDPTGVVLDGSRIVARAGQGEGGSIAIRTDLLLVSQDSLVSASSDLGIDGTVDIEAPDVDLTGSLVALPETPLDATGLLRERCAAARSDQRGSFVVRGREAVPASHAEGLMLALVPPLAVPTTTGREGPDLVLAAAMPTASTCPAISAAGD